MSYIICGYKGVGKSTYAHNYSYSKSLKHYPVSSKFGYKPRIIYNFEDLDTSELVLRGLQKAYNEKDDAVILFPLNDEVVTALHDNNYPFATLFPDPRLIDRWESRLFPSEISNFENDCIKWKKDKRSTVQFVIKDPNDTGMNGWMVDSIVLMMDRKLKK